MKNLMKRLGGVFLAIIMVVSLMPVQVKASETIRIEDLLEMDLSQSPVSVQAGDVITSSDDDAYGFYFVLKVGEEYYYLMSNSLTHTVPTTYEIPEERVDITSATGWNIVWVEKEGEEIVVVMESQKAEIKVKGVEQLENLVEKYFDKDMTLTEGYGFCSEFLMREELLPDIAYELYEERLDSLYAKAAQIFGTYYKEGLEEILAIDKGAITRDELSKYIDCWYFMRSKYYYLIFEDVDRAIWDAIEDANKKLLEVAANFVVADVESIETSVDENGAFVIEDPEYAFVLAEWIDRINKQIYVLDAVKEVSSEIYYKYDEIAYELMLGDFGYFKQENPNDVMLYIYRFEGAGEFFDSFDIIGKFGENYVQTTYGWKGFETYLLVDNLQIPVSASKGGMDIYTTGINVAIQLKTVNEGKAVQISYIIKNTSDKAVVYGLASGTDIQIGNDDYAPISVFEDGAGLKMVSSKSYDANEAGEYPQFNFFGKDRKGVVNVDGFWYGNYGSREINYFSNTNGKPYEGDSGITWHWNNRTLAAGATETLSVLIGISAEGEEGLVGGGSMPGGEAASPKTDAEKVAEIENVVKDTLESITEVNNDSDVKAKVEAAVAAALAANKELAGTTVTYEITKTAATTTAAGSIQGKVVITSGEESKEVTVSYTIEKLSTSAHQHDYIWVIVKDATDADKGEMKGTCSCGESQTKEIPATEGDDASGNITVESDKDNDFQAQLSDAEDVKGKIELTQKEQDAIIAGQDLEIILKLEDTTVVVDTEEKEEIAQKLEDKELEGKKLGTFLDINLIKKVGNIETNITNTNGMIKLVFEVPASLRNTDATINRTYTIVRNHEGKVEFLRAEFDKETNQLTFETDKFSTYAVIYEDSAVTVDLPNTGDTTNVIPFIMLLLAGLGLVVVGSKKRMYI